MEFLTLGVLEDQLDIVEDVAAIFDVVRTTYAYDVLRLRAKHPVGDIDLVGGEFGGKTTGHLFVLAPVDLPVGAVFGKGLVPGVFGKGVAMPLATDVRDRAEHAFVDHLLGSLVELGIAALQADLEGLLGF